MDNLLTALLWILWISGAGLLISGTLAGLLGLIYDRDKLHALGVLPIPSALVGSTYMFYALNAHIIGFSFLIYSLLNSVLFLFLWLWLGVLFENRSVEILGFIAKVTGVVFFATVGMFYVLLY